MSLRNYFQGKRIAVIGLGWNGEMIADIRYLVKAGALVSLYDLASERRAAVHMAFLRSAGLAAYEYGRIPLEDVLDMDLVILSHEYPKDSSFLKEVREKKIPVEYSETLFFKLSPPVTLVGVFGACGKSTLISMLSPMLETACATLKEQAVYVIDSESENGALAHLRKIKSSDIVIVRMESSLMRDLHAMRISPHVAIFTTVPPLGSYSETPFEILQYQTYNNFIVAPDHVIDATYAHKFQPKAKMFRTKTGILPSDWPIKGRGLHDRDNAALALQAARIFKVSDEMARNVLEKWRPIKGRLELVKKVKNAEFYNDTAAVSPSATIVGIKSLALEKNIILIFGGAQVGREGGADFRELYSFIPRHVHMLISVPGSGTLRERPALRTLHDIEVRSAPSIEEAVRLALENAKKGDKVLFSPGFEAGGFDRTRQERGERFVKAVRGL